MTCPLCGQHVPGRHGSFTLDDLCARHRTDIQESLDELQRIHPNGEHTQTCGCMTLEAFEARRGITQAQMR